MKTCTLVLALFLLAFGSFSSAQSKPARFRFMSYDINPKNPVDITVAINTVDPGKTHFRSIGDTIPFTQWKIKSFEKKEAPGANGTKQDISEVTLENLTTKATLVLPLNKVVDSPATQ